MPGPGNLQQRPRAVLFGSFCLLAGLGVALLAPPAAAWRWPLTTGLGVVAVFSLLLLGEHTVEGGAAGSILRGGQASLRSALDGLHLEGSGVYVPGARSGDPERLFLPASPSGKARPSVEPDRVVYAEDPDEQAGVALPPPGLELLDAYEETLDTRLRGGTVNDAVHFLQAVGDGSGLFRRLDLTRTDEGLTARFEPHVETPCLEETRRGEETPSCVQAGCPVCSLVATSLVRALQRPLRVEDLRRRGDQIELVLEAPD